MSSFSNDTWRPVASRACIVIVEISGSGGEWTRVTERSTEKARSKTEAKALRRRARSLQRSNAPSPMGVANRWSGPNGLVATGPGLGKRKSLAKDVLAQVRMSHEYHTRATRTTKTRRRRQHGKVTCFRGCWCQYLYLCWLTARQAQI